MTLPTTPARDAARAEFERQPVTVLELDIDRCQNVYGSSPCTAAAGIGRECYNTYATCQDKANYARGVHTLKFVSRGSAIPPGEPLRPYLMNESNVPTAIDVEAGLARRSMLKITLADETDEDIELDPYVATRPQPAAGTFWGRFMRRNLHYAGRMARVRRGFVTNPWNWDTFIDELYIIDSIAGPTSDGTLQIVLKDPLKLADKSKIPAATDGKIQRELKAIEHEGIVASATLTTVVLPSEASAVDGSYDGMEIQILQNTGAGQRRTITGYVGATRTATVSAWSVVPDSTSRYEIGQLFIDVGVNKGAQYADPAVTGRREFVRIGDEIIEYTAKNGDVLSWPDTSYRGAFGTVRKDHKAGDSVQMCRAFINQRAWIDVIKALLNESGIDDDYINLDQLNAEDDQWLGAGYAITACISKPESPTAMISEILQQTNGVMWWSAALQKICAKLIMPSAGAPMVWSDEANFLQGSVDVSTQDDLRLTSAAIYFAIESATASISEAKHYRQAELYVDADAESANEYGDQRPDVTYSRWFTTDNQIAMRGLVSRRLAYRRDAPKSIKFQLDPKDYIKPPGEYVDVQTRRLVNVTGRPERVRALITKVSDRGSHIEVEARTTPFARRYAFIAPAGTADYPDDTTYAHMAGNTGRMSDGGAPYLII